MLHKWEAMLGLPEDSLAYQMGEYYPMSGEYPEEPENDQEESSSQLHS